MDTTDTGERACLGADVLDGRAHFGGDGCLFDEEEIGFDDRGLLGFLVLGEKGIGLIGVNVFSSESCGAGSFDHGQGCHDVAKGVRDLVAEYC